MGTGQKLRIGTSGWCYKHWSHGAFYPEKLAQKKQLSFYSENFETVEINNTFYNTPKEQVFTNWRDTVQEGFVFSVKMNRFVTHIMKLKDPYVHLERFFKPCSALKDKIGPILFQFSRPYKVDTGRLRETLLYIKEQKHIKHPRLAFEFRSADCITDEVIALLEDHNAAVCFHDHPDAVITKPITADFIYIRRHGPTGTYCSRYDHDMLTDDANRIKRWLADEKDVYVYFNNDAEAFAVQNAKELIAILKA